MLVVVDSGCGCGCCWSVRRGGWTDDGHFGDRLEAARCGEAKETRRLRATTAGPPAATLLARPRQTLLLLLLPVCAKVKGAQCAGHRAHIIILLSAAEGHAVAAVHETTRRWPPPITAGSTSGTETNSPLQAVEWEHVTLLL